MTPALSLMLRRLLRPLVGTLMRQGVGYIAFRDLLKRIYVEEALSRQDEELTTDSAISLVTGINRGEIKRLRASIEAPEALAEQNAMAGVNLAARVVATWVSHADFRDEAGNPRPLAIHGDVDKDFDALLRAAKVDVRAKTVISELERAGVVSMESGGTLRLLRGAFTPTVPEDMMLFLAANVGDHLRAALHNLEGGQPAFIERALFHNGLSAARVEALRARLSGMGDRLLREANEILLEDRLTGTDNAVREKGDAKKRLRLGVFYFETDASDAA